MADLPQDPAEYAQWQTKALSKVYKLRQNPSPEQIAQVGSLLTALDLPYNLEKGDRPVYTEAKATLLAIPGHAEYFGKKITDAHREYKANPRSLEYANSHEYISSLENIATLKHLPSPETVRVAGEMLSDEWADETVNSDERAPSLARVAASILSALPIRDKPYPFRDSSPSREEVTASLPDWQRWYRQVKEGRRTFSFEGDPNEYSLQGPVREARNPDIPRATKRPEIPSLQETEKASQPATSRLPWIVAAIAALSAAGGWFFLKRQPAE